MLVPGSLQVISEYLKYCFTENSCRPELQVPTRVDAKATIECSCRNTCRCTYNSQSIINVILICFTALQNCFTPIELSQPEMRDDNRPQSKTPNHLQASPQRAMSYLLRQEKIYFESARNITQT